MASVFVKFIPWKLVDVASAHANLKKKELLPRLADVASVVAKNPFCKYLLSVVEKNLFREALLTWHGA